MKLQVRQQIEFEDQPVPPARPTKRQRRLTGREVEELVVARRSGAQIDDLAEQFRIHRATIINHLERQGVAQRRWPGRMLSPERLQAAGELYATGLSLVAVGERFDVDKRYLRKALPEVGYEIRPPGRSKASQI